MTDHDLAERPDLRTARGLLRRRYAVMLPFLLIPIAAFFFSDRQEKRYTASASLVFSETEHVASSDPAREAATNIQLLSDDQIKRGVQRRLGGTRAIADEVKFQQEGEANVLKVTATDPVPQRAANTANAYVNEYVAFRRNAARSKIINEQRFVRSELRRVPRTKANRGRVRALQQRLRRLQFDASQEQGGAQVLSAATAPRTPSSPKPVRNAVIGAIVALFLAVLTAVLFERLDPRLTTTRDVGITLGPVLGTIRNSRALGRSSAASQPAPADADDFLALLARLRYANLDRDVRSVLVTSSTEGDGKTTVAWNLARAAAGPETRVLFVEADLRNPTLARALGADPERSLARVLGGQGAFREVIQQIAFPNARNGGRASPVVSVALAGNAPTRSTDALAWERLGSALREAERDFDLIVIDTPPMLSVPDAIPLLSRVDGVVVVSRLGRTPRAALARLKEQLDAVGAPTLGVVVNSVGKDARYGYGYGYHA